MLKDCNIEDRYIERGKTTIGPDVQNAHLMASILAIGFTFSELPLSYKADLAESSEAMRQECASNENFRWRKRLQAPGR
jgi:hypothetical protein